MRNSAVVAGDSIDAGKIQLKATRREHKHKKEQKEDDSHLPVCTMAPTQGYTHVQTARRGTPFKASPRRRGTRGR